MVNTLFEEGLVKPGRLSAFTDGILTVEKTVKGFTPENVSAVTGILPDDIRNLVREFSKREKAVCYGRIGTCTQTYGTLSTWLILVFNILSGKMDQPGGYMFPTPALDMVSFTAMTKEKGWVGKHHTRVSGYPDFTGDFPSAALAEEILTPGKGKIRGLISIVGNPVLSAPNGQLVDKALADLDFMVSVDWYITESSRHAHIILPPTTILEHSNHTMMVNFAGVRNFAAYSEAVLPKDPDTRHNWEIISELNARVVKNPLIKFIIRLARPEWLLDGFLRFGPHGSKLKFWGPGLSLSKLKKKKHGIDLGPLKSRLPGRLFTKTKRIQLAPENLVNALQELKSKLPGLSVAPVPPYDLLLIGRRNRMSNNSWFHNFSRLHNRANRCTLRLNPGDAGKKQIRTGDMVHVISSISTVLIEAEVTYRIMPGVVSIPHGWGHGLQGVCLAVASAHPGVSINDLTDQKLVDLSGNAAFSGVPVRIEKVMG